MTKAICVLSDLAGSPQNTCSLHLSINLLGPEETRDCEEEFRAAEDVHELSSAEVLEDSKRASGSQAMSLA